MNIIEKGKVVKAIERISFNEVLENADEIIRKWNNNAISREISVSQNLGENLQEIIKDFIEIDDKLPYIKKMFIYDKKFSNGFVKKSVINSLKISKYKKYINSLVEKLEQNKENLLKDISYTMDYIMWHDISANKTEIIKTIDVFSNVLKIIISNLIENNSYELDNLIFIGVFLERRLYQLYCIYGHYLNEIGRLNEYVNNLEYFEKLDDAFQNLVSYIH